MIVVKSSSKTLAASFEELGENYKDVELKRNFPKTRYYGSKLRLIDWVNHVLKPLEYQTVLDPFGGTATTALLFKSLQKEVTYNDILESNRQSAISLLSTESLKFKKDKVLDFPSSVSPKAGFITSTFEDVYYSTDENMWLDGAYNKISNMRDKQTRADILYCTFQPCLQKRPFNLFHRKNYNIRKNCSKKTNFGNWVTWEKSFEELFVRAVSELEKAKSISGAARVLDCTDASEIDSGYDLVYVDPPYVRNTKNDLDYMGRYHFLEGLCSHDWEERINWEKKHRPIYSGNELVEWNSKSHFKDRLFDFLIRHKNSIVVLSYESGGFPSFEELTLFFKQNFKNVFIFTHNISHALNKNKKEEVIFVGC